jgi:hypothetical protein
MLRAVKALSFGRIRVLLLLLMCVVLLLQGWLLRHGGASTVSFALYFALFGSMQYTKALELQSLGKYEKLGFHYMGAGMMFGFAIMMVSHALH